MKLEFDPLICCDYCNETYGNRFDCPECKEYAETDISEAVYEMNVGDTFGCCTCKAEFCLEVKEGYFSDDFEWVLIRNREGEFA